MSFDEKEEKDEKRAELLTYSTKEYCDGWMVLHYGMHAMRTEPLLWLEFTIPSVLEKVYQGKENDVHSTTTVDDVRTTLLAMLSEPLREKIKSQSTNELSEQDRKQIFQELEIKLKQQEPRVVKFESLLPEKNLITQKYAKWGKLESFIADNLMSKLKSLLDCLLSESKISELEIPDIHMIGAGFTEKNITFLTEFLVYHKKSDMEYVVLGRISVKESDSEMRKKSLQYVLPL